MQGSVLAGDPIPGANDNVEEIDHSAIVGDSNLWDDLIYDRDGNVVNDQTNTSGGSSGSGSTDTTGDNQNEDGDSVIFEEEKTKARTQIVTVTVEESVTKEAQEDSTSNVMIIIPIVIAVVLLVVAVAIIIKCYQSRQKSVMTIQENLKAVAQTESAFHDTQYQMRNDDDKSNIFSRTSTTQHKLRVADNDVVEDAFGDQHVSVATSNNNTSANNFTSANMNANSDTKLKGSTQMLGDNLQVKK